MNRFCKVNLGADGWGLLVNEGSAEEPKFRVVLKGSERWMERIATQMNADEMPPQAAAGNVRHD